MISKKYRREYIGLSIAYAALAIVYIGIQTESCYASPPVCASVFLNFEETQFILLFFSLLIGEILILLAFTLLSKRTRIK